MARIPENEVERLKKEFIVGISFSALVRTNYTARQQYGNGKAAIPVVVPFEIHRPPTVPGGAVNLIYANTQAPHREENPCRTGRVRTVQF